MRNNVMQSYILKRYMIVDLKIAQSIEKLPDKLFKIWL